MKRLHYIVALTLCLTACHHDETVDVTRPVDSSTPIKVAGALSKNETTRAAMKGLTSNNDWQTGDQFVVNAHYYYSTTTTLAQDFMVDTPVTYTTSGTSWYGTTNYWDYSPIKYWPQQGYLDFFAVYPKDYYDNNLDRQRLFHEELDRTVIKTRFYLDAPKDMTITDLPTDRQFMAYTGNVTTGGEPEQELITKDTTYNDAIEQWDLMFSHRPHLSKPDVSTPVKFLFSHAEMAVRFWTGHSNAAEGPSLDIGNNADFTITDISLNDIHIGGLITATDVTDWQQYYNEFGSEGVITNTAGASTPVKLSYEWDWENDPYAPDKRDTYTQTTDFLWAWTDGNGLNIKDPRTPINPGNKVFIIPPQCLGAGSGSSITVYFIYHDAGGTIKYGNSTFNVEFCGKPGDVLDIYLGNTVSSTTDTYEIEVITATLTPWEDIYGEVITDLEK